MTSHSLLGVQSGLAVYSYKVFVIHLYLRVIEFKGAVLIVPLRLFRCPPLEIRLAMVESLKLAIQLTKDDTLLIKDQCKHFHNKQRTTKSLLKNPVCNLD